MGVSEDPRATSSSSPESFSTRPARAAAAHPRAPRGPPRPAGTGARWLAVLDDAEKLLNGQVLIPYWRLRQGAGLNLQSMFEDPIPVDIAEWVHGVGLMRYAEEGQRLARDNWLDFTRLARGDTMMFVVFLN